MRKWILKIRLWWIEKQEDELQQKSMESFRNYDNCRGWQYTQARRELSNQAMAIHAELLRRK